MSIGLSIVTYISLGSIVPIGILYDFELSFKEYTSIIVMNCSPFIIHVSVLNLFLSIGLLTFLFSSNFYNIEGLLTHRSSPLTIDTFTGIMISGLSSVY